jgi:hypothetical protein
MLWTDIFALLVKYLTVSVVIVGVPELAKYVQRIASGRTESSLQFASPVTLPPYSPPAYTPAETQTVYVTASAYQDAVDRNPTQTYFAGIPQNGSSTFNPYYLNSQATSSSVMSRFFGGTTGVWSSWEYYCGLFGLAMLLLLCPYVFSRRVRRTISQISLALKGDEPAALTAVEEHVSSRVLAEVQEHQQVQDKKIDDYLTKADNDYSFFTLYHKDYLKHCEEQILEDRNTVRSVKAAIKCFEETGIRGGLEQVVEEWGNFQQAKVRLRLLCLKNLDADHYNS